MCVVSHYHNSPVTGGQRRFRKNFYEIPLINVACMGDNVQSTSGGLAGWRYSYQIILIFTLCHINKWITAHCYTWVDCSALQLFSCKQMDHRTLLYLGWLFSLTTFQTINIWEREVRDGLLIIQSIDMSNSCCITNAPDGTDHPILWGNCKLRRFL
jgi:hypothetical protein